jgi:hypothetical protein
MNGQTCATGGAPKSATPRPPLTAIAQDITDKACRLKGCLAELAVRLYPEESSNKECVDAHPPTCLEGWLNAANETLCEALDRFNCINEKL